MSYKVDNFDNIEKLLVFNKDKKDIYYFIQVIQRKKDNPDLPKSEICRGRWYITSIKEYTQFKNWIIKTCIDYNARAYISLTPRSLEKLGKKCLLEYSKRVSNGDYNNIFSITNKSALSDYTIQSRGLIDKPRWVIDVDYEDPNANEKILEFLNKYKIITVVDIKTPRGFHKVIKAFNPNLISEYKKGKTDDYFVKDINLGFTLRMECNTILFAYKA